MFSPEPRSLSWAKLVRFCLTLSIWLLLPTSANATLIIKDPTDPAFLSNTAFADSLAVPLDETLPVNPGDQSFTLTQVGVQFLFQTTSSFDLACDGPGGTPPCFLVAGSAITIVINPPIPAVGFITELSECNYVATFVGTLGSESFGPGPSSVPLFIGAADIGDISAVTLNDTCNLGPGRLSAMRIVLGRVTPGHADVDVDKGTHFSTIGAEAPLSYNIDVTNKGPDEAKDVFVVDFLPPGVTFNQASDGGMLDPAAPLVTWSLGDRAAASSNLLTLNVTTPPFGAPGEGTFSCEDTLLNIAVVTTTTAETNVSNNLAFTTTPFSKVTRADEPEICDNGIDDNCDGLIDCFDSTCATTVCRRSVAEAPAPDPNDGDSGDDDGLCINIHGDVFAPCCCDTTPSGCTFTNISCRAFDPNFKESDPPTNAFGYGYTEAGQTMTYTIHYENIGGVDAHEVSILDALHPDLDDTTLVINDGGVYDPTTRVIVWNDPLSLPPHEPRSVSFAVNVRADAPVGLRVRNAGTIIFPEAVSPRTDTNFVEHTVIDPQFPPVADLRVVECVPSGVGPDQWTVKLQNTGFGFAYNVTAAIVNPPGSVQVSDGMAHFVHPDDLNPAQLATMMPLSTSMSVDTVAFTTAAPGNLCEALTWHITYTTSSGEPASRDVQAAIDGDADGVPDSRDNCPLTSNPTQANSDGDRVGDVCDQCPNDPNKTEPGACGCSVADTEAGQACSTGQPGVCNAGTKVCANGTLSCQPNQQPSVEACDDLDNNCNGTADEGNPGGGASCSTGLLGVCGAGTRLCTNGTLVCQQTTQPGVEICGNNVDENCNGADLPCPPSPSVDACTPTTVLDTFNRSDGSIGTNWRGVTGPPFYRLAGNRLDVQAGGPVYWNPAAFGTSQAAFVTLSSVDAKSPSQGVLLKVQSGSVPDAGAIAVVYDAAAKAVRVSTLRLGALSWTPYGNTAVLFTNGDKLGACAKANGEVRVYKNDALVKTVTLSAADQGFFNLKGGKVGVWSVLAPQAFMDDFGGATLAP